MPKYEPQSLPPGTPEEIALRALTIWQNGNREAALDLYNKAITLMPDEASLYLNRGNLKMELGLIDEAIQDLQEAVSRESTLPAGNLALCNMLKANPVLLEAYLKGKGIHAREKKTLTITREVAGEIARRYLMEHPVSGIDGIDKVITNGEPGYRKPAFYQPEPIDMDKCWIVYAKRIEKPNTLYFGGSHIILISMETGKVIYSGIDGD